LLGACKWARLRMRARESRRLAPGGLVDNVLDRISPIFSPFFPVFGAFSPSRRGGSNEPQAGIQGHETVSRAPKHRFGGPANSGTSTRCGSHQAGSSTMSPTGGALPRFHSSKMSSKGGRVSATHSLPSWCLRTFQEHARPPSKPAPFCAEQRAFRPVPAQGPSVSKSAKSAKWARTRAW